MRESSRKIIYEIFKKSSVNYYYSSKFFPRNIRDQVATLYAFVRLTDNFVDQEVQDWNGFNNFIELYNDLNLKNTLQIEKFTNVNKIVVSEFILLKRNKKFSDEWIKSFFSSMKSDFSKKTYKDMEELYEYMFGSAVVIGYMLCRIFDLPEKAFKYAEHMANAMQIGNFIRDIGIDYKLNRTYIPISILSKYNLSTLSTDIKENVFKNIVQDFSVFYFKHVKEAMYGIKYLPYSMKVPVVTSIQMYNYSVSKVLENPKSVFEICYKPSKCKVIFTAIVNLFKYTFI